jgi:hypothetical protein
LPRLTKLRAELRETAIALAVLCLIVCGPIAAYAQDGLRPPDFSQPDLAAAADEVGDAHKAWRLASRNLELEVFRLAMADARVRVQSALSAALHYIDQRQRYAEKVAGTIERYRVESTNRKPIVNVETVSRDEIDVLDANLTDLVAKLEVLRSSPQEWVRIRRGVQADQTAITALQSKLREDIPVDTLFRPAPPKLVSAIVYRDGERQLHEVLQKTWVHYYQSVIDAVEQKPNGSAPLVSSISGSLPPATSGNNLSAPAAGPAPASAAPRADSPGLSLLAGSWGYIEGTQQFNGVSEPHQVLLELWMESGVLLGRYRAELPDFDGAKKVDLRLRAKMGKGGQTILQIQSGDPVATGEFVIEDTGSGGLNLMLVRSVDAGGPIPRGRELLTRR